MLCPGVLNLSVISHQSLVRLYGTLHVCKCFLLFSVTEDHPEVQAMVLTALEEAKHMSASPFGLYAEVLKTRIKEVCEKI